MATQGRNFGKCCVVCDKRVNHVRRHTNLAHLPWYMSPAFACVTCQQTGGPGELNSFHSGHSKVDGDSSVRAWYLLVNGFLLFIGRCLGLTSLDTLLTFVVAQKLYPQYAPFSEDELVFLRKYDQLAGLVPNVSHAASPPTRVSELLNINILANLLQKLSTRERDSAKGLQSYLNSDGTNPPQGHPVFKLHIIDGHFHLDELIGRTGSTFVQLESLSKSSIHLLHAVANFVYPSKWGQINALMRMDSRISFSLGVHPHLLYRNGWEAMFAKLERQLERFPQSVAIGEVGIDLTTTCRCRAPHNEQHCVKGKVEAQRSFLEKSLLLADRLGKPVIIHCRDAGDGSAAAQTLDAFVRCKVTHLKVQRHCFVGNSEELKAWSITLPNCFFSLSRQSTLDSSTREALLMADHPKLILETDSPYLPFPRDHKHGPWRVGEVASAVSNLLGLPEAQLARMSNRNIQKLFGIKF